MVCSKVVENESIEIVWFVVILFLYEYSVDFGDVKVEMKVVRRGWNCNVLVLGERK